MLVKTTTLLKDARTDAQSAVLSARQRERLNELKASLREGELRELLDGQELSDFLSSETAAAALSTQSVLFSLPTPTRGDVAPTHETDAPPTSDTRSAQPDVAAPIAQAKREGGAPSDDPDEDDAFTGHQREDLFQTSSLDTQEASPVEDEPSGGSRSIVDQYEALFPVQRRNQPGSLSAPRLPNLRAGGATLPESVRKKMEDAFGVDFKSVRILVGPEAAAIGAVAFTRGEQIFFAPGRYDPLSQSGQELIGHELAHVVQQRAGRVRPDTGSFLNTDTGLEREADVAGAAAAAGQRAQVAGAGATGGGLAVQRDTGSGAAPSVTTEDGNVGGALGEDKDKNLTGTITVKQATLRGGIRLVDVSGTGTLKGDRLKDFSGSATIIFPIDGVDTYKVVCKDLVVSPGAKIESGSGTLTTLREIDVAKGKIYRLAIAEGASAKATLGYNRVSEIDGNLTATLFDADGALLSLTFAGKVNPNPKRVSFNGTATATSARTITLLEKMGPNQDWSVYVDKGAALTATFDDNKLTNIGPSVTVVVADAQGPAVDLKLEGNLEFNKKSNKPRMVMTSGTATTKRDFFLYAIPNTGWQLFAKGGSELTLEFEEGRPKGFKGTIPLSLRDAAGELATLTLDGTSTLKGVVDGTATAALARDVPIPLSTDAEGGPCFTVKGGAAATMTFVKSKATRLTATGKGVFDGTLNEQPLTVNVDGELDVDVDKRKLTSAKGSLALAKDIVFPDQHLRVTQLKATGEVGTTGLKSVTGTIESVLFDDAGDLVTATIDGAWDPQAGLSGTGKAVLQRNLEQVVSETTDTRVSILKGTEATATYAKGALTTITGKLNGQLSVGGVPRASLVVDGTYNVATNTIDSATGKATLLEPIALLDGKVTVTGATLQAELAKGKLTKVAGDVQVTAPDLKVDKATLAFSWRNDGTQDLYSVKGTVDWTFFDEGERSLKGALAIDYKEDKSFTATAKATYALNQYIKGGGTVQVDEKVEPEVIEGWLSYKQTLIEPRDLFRMQMKLFDMTIPVGIPGVNVEFGMSMGTGLALQALPINADVKLTEAWKLKADDDASRIPAFETTINPEWGADFDANIAAWLGLALGAPLAKVALGAKGKVILTVGLTTSPSLTVGGGADTGFYGKLKVGAKVVPTLTLQIVPYTKASLGSFYEAEKEFSGWEHPLANFAGLDWSMEYGFGDSGGKAIKTNDAPEFPASGTQSAQKTSKTMEYPTSSPSEGDGKTAPSLGGADVAKSQKAKAESAQGANKSESQSKLEQIITITKGLGALEQLLSLIGGAIKAFAMAGPIGFGAYLAWKAFKGELSWDKLVNQVTLVQEALSAIADLLADKLNPKVLTLLRVLSGDVSIKDALFGNKSKMIQEVQDGMHREVLPEVRSDMVNVLVGTVCTGQAEDMALEVLRYSAQQGDLRTVMLTVVGGPDKIIGAFDGSNSTEIKEIFRTNGIPFREGLGRIFGVGEDSGGKLAEEELLNVNNLDGTPAKRRAGLIDRLVEGGKKNGDVLTVVSKSKAMGDLADVVELVNGKTKAIRDNVPDSMKTALNRALFLGGVNSIAGLAIGRIAELNIAGVLPDSVRIKVLTQLMGNWYVSDAEENTIVAVLQTAKSRNTVVAAAKTTSGRIYDRMSGSNANTVASMFGGVSKLQRKGGKGPALQATADAGFSGTASRLPHAEAIQASFGRHDISGVQAFTDEEAAKANRQMGARAYASGDKVAFGSGTDLHTAAHEAAHTVQQKAGVQFKADGQGSDALERHADAVADAVVQGKSAEGLLDQYVGGAGAATPDSPGESGASVQAKSDDTLGDALQKKPAKGSKTAAPKTAPVQRLVEHFDAVKGEDD